MSATTPFLVRAIAVLVCAAAIVYLLAQYSIVHAATYTWDNSSGDGLWSTCTNWSTDICPGAADTVVFNGTSVTNSTVDAAFAGTVDAIQMNAGYTGTTTLARNLTVDGTGGFSQSAGTFDISGFTLTLSEQGGDFTVSSGTYLATNATTTFTGNGVAGSITQTLTCTGTLPGVVDPGTGNSLFTLASGCNATLASTVSKTGFITLSGDATLPVSFTSVKGISIAGNATALSGTTIAITGQNGTNPSLTVTGSLAGLSSVATTTFSANFGATTFTCTGTWPGVVSLSGNGSFTLASGCDITLASAISKSGSVTLDGNATAQAGSTITMTGINGSNTSLTVTGSLAGFANLSTTTFSGSTSNQTQTLNCTGTWPGVVSPGTGLAAFSLGAGCSATLPQTISKSGSITLAGNATVPSGSTITITGAASVNTFLTVTGSLSGLANLTSTSFTNNSAGNSQTLTCTGTWPGVVNVGTGASSFILSAGCIATLSGNTTKSGPVTNNGTFDLGGFTFSPTSYTVAGTSTTRLIGNETVTPITPTSCATVEYYGSGSYTSLVGGTTYGHLVFSGSGTYATSSALTVNCDFTQTAGTTNLTGTLTFASTTVASTMTTSAGTNVTNLTLNKSGNTLTLGGSGLTLGGALTITAGTLDASAAGCSSASCNITLSGGWSNSGTFTPRTGTVAFAAGNQSLTGATSFYRLTKTVSSASTLTFPAGATQTVANTLTLQGAAGNLLSLVSSSPGSQWSIDPQGTRTISYLSVTDSNNSNATVIDATDGTHTNGGNTTNWNFNTATESVSGGGSAAPPRPATQASSSTSLLVGSTTTSDGTLSTSITPERAPLPAPKIGSEYQPLVLSGEEEKGPRAATSTLSTPTPALLPAPSSDLTAETFLVPRIARILLPVLIFLGLAGSTAALIALSGISLLTSPADLGYLFLRFLNSVLVFFGLRKRGRPWGVVYDSVTKRPLDPAYVRLFDSQGRVVNERITDMDGRFGFLLTPGAYTMDAAKTHYQFPSLQVAGKMEDVIYSDLYTGGPFTAREGEVMTKNIPMDPVGFDWNEFEKNKRNLFRFYTRRQALVVRAGLALYAVGLASALLGAWLDPGLGAYVVLSLYALVAGLRVFWLPTHRAVALTNPLGAPYAFAIVRVYDPTLDTVVKTVVADRLGRVYLLLTPGTYRLTIEEPLPGGTYRPVYADNYQMPRGVLEDDLVISGFLAETPVLAEGVAAQSHTYP